MPVPVEGYFVLIPFAKDFGLWSRSNPAHLAFYDVDELWEFVEPIFAKISADPRYSIIVIFGHRGVAVAVPHRPVRRHRP